MNVSSRSNAGLLLCIEMILQHQISNTDHIYSFETDLHPETPSFRYDFSRDVHYEDFRWKPNMYIVNLTVIKLNEAIETLKSVTEFNPKAKFIFIVPTFNTEMLRFLSSVFISKVTFIDSVFLNITTFYPYRKKSFRDFDFEDINLGSCSQLGKSELIDFSFFNKNQHDFAKGSVMKMCFLYEPGYSTGPNETQVGINLEIFNLLLERIGLIPEWYDPGFPDDGNFTNYKRAILANNEICDCFVGLYIVKGLDHIVPYTYENVNFLVRVPLKVPRWRYLLHVLSFEVWCYWISTCFILSLVWYFVYFILERNFHSLRLLTVFWINIQYFIEGSPVVRIINVTTKLLFFCLFIQAFFMNMIFKCNFNVVLSSLIYEEPIRSFQDIVDRDMIFGVFEVEDLEHLIKIMGKREYVETHYQVCNSSIYCATQSMLHGKLAVEATAIFLKYNQKFFVGEDRVPLLKWLDQPFQKTIESALLPLGHPLTGVLDKWMFRAFASGFLEIIRKNYDYELKALPKILETSPLTLEHILTPCIILFIGYLAGVFTLILEIHSLWKPECEESHVSRS